MTARRDFLEIEDPFAQDVMDHVTDLVAMDARDMGPVRAQLRSWPSPTGWAVLGVLVAGSVALVATAPDADQVVIRSASLAVLLLGYLVFVAQGAIERHRVCEHGLVVGFRTRSQYVIPWSTIDPGRVRVVRRPLWLGRQKDGPGASPHFRVGLLGSRALAVNGLDTAITGWVHVPGFTRVADAREPGSAVRVTPFVWWMLGTQRPERLAQEIEAAMVADGYRAQGLAERAVRQAVTMPVFPKGPPLLPTRMATDRVLGADGPALPPGSR